jgi:hypothetical protein
MAVDAGVRAVELVDDLVDRLVLGIAVAGGKFRALLEIHHQRHRDARAVGPAWVWRLAAIAGEIAL